MCGYVSHEGIIMIAGLKSDMYNEINEDVDNLLLHPNLSRFLSKHDVSAHDVKQFYFGDEKLSSDSTDKIVDMLGDLNFVIGLHNFIEIQSNIPNIPTYFYKFEYEIPNSQVKKFFGLPNIKGTCHMEELGFLFYQNLSKLFGQQPSTPDSVGHVLIQRFTELWTNFAKTGNPTPRKTDATPIKWEPVDCSNEYKCLHITDKLDMITEFNITQQLCDSVRNKT
uniref:Carboxylesterase 7 n=1 Tax=Meteorus pulchricornis TaxID=51522 RepID=A0A4D6J618_9HYME|nr:carboxylesterase 7 [Meteorus pulchricornis]